MNALPIQMRREFWEHRVLWMVPLIVCALYLAACLIPGTKFSMGDLDVGAPGSAERPLVVFVVMNLIFFSLLYVLMTVVGFFYLADCLYAERKDRSILFWKSMPVSDASTVLSKVLVALLAVPLIVYALAVLTNLLAFGILSARFHGQAGLHQLVQWDTLAWLRMNWYLLLDIVVLSLWFAPIAAYQILISAWAPRNVLVWTVLPPLMLIFGERAVNGTWHVWDFVVYRLGGAFGAGGRVPVEALMDHTGRSQLDILLERVSLLRFLALPDLWIGVAVAIVLVFGAIRIRRYRDDS